MPMEFLSSSSKGSSSDPQSAIDDEEELDTHHLTPVRSMSKRSPSILVTDYRSNRSRKSAPFAGHAAAAGNISSKNMINNNYISHNTYGTKQNVAGTSSSNKLRNRLYQRNSSKRKNSNNNNSKFSDISIDNILSDSTEIPSARREERGSFSSNERLSLYSSNFDYIKNHLNYKTINPLPTRTSKTSQKLVLIPEDEQILSSINNNNNNNNSKQYSSQHNNDKQKQNSNSNKYYNSKNKINLPRVTAYYVSEAINLKTMSKFLKKFHKVSPRLYDECLYVAYTLPLLPGQNGFRIKSNISKTIIGGKTIIDKMIDTSEQRDHHYEYYSGVEVLEDANNNYEINSNLPLNDINKNIPDHLPNPNINTITNNNNQDNFDPSEPQYFPEEIVSSTNSNESNSTKINSNNGNSTNITDDKNMKINSSINNSKNIKPNTDQHAEIFIFRYGVIVFWNFTESQEKNILGDISFADYKNLIIKPLDEQDIETEHFHFEYDTETERPRIFNDVITLQFGDHIIKLTLSHAIAQSSKLSRFESRLEPILSSVIKLPKRLALYGTLGLTRHQLLKKSGRLFSLRVDVNLSSSVLDTPEFFWTFEPSLHPLYVAMREYLEIDQRVQVVNDRCMVLLEFFNICVDSVAERNIARVTWWFILVLILGVLFSLTEILIRYLIITKHL